MGIWSSLGVSGLLCSACALAGDAHWIRIESPNFEMYSSAGERSARETLRHFEQIRSFFEQSMGSTPARISRVEIVAFGSRKEYEPYRINEFATAYYEGTADRDYIVLSQTGSEAFPIAVHEYVHLYASRTGLNLPPWLNEGLAELYSTLRPVRDQLFVGGMIPGRYRALRYELWVPLTSILSADRNSPLYNEKRQAGSLYNEGWALTHMLALSPAYRPKFSDLLISIHDGTASQEALTRTYGKTLSEIENDLQSYIRGRFFQGVFFPLKLEKSAGDLPSSPVSAFDVNLMLADLIDRPGKQEEVGSRLKKLSEVDPSRPEPFTRLGYLALRRDDRDQAQRHFDVAFKLGSRDPRMLWDYGRMVQTNDASASLLIFKELLEHQPDRVDVRLELASVQLGLKQPKAALETLAPITKVGESQAPKLFTIMAYAQLESGNRLEGLKAAIELARVARRREDRVEAERLLKSLVEPERTEPDLIHLVEP